MPKIGVTFGILALGILLRRAAYARLPNVTASRWKKLEKHINQSTDPRITHSISNVHQNPRRAKRPPARATKSRVASRREGRVSFVPRAPFIRPPRPQTLSYAARHVHHRSAPTPPGLGRLGLGLRRGGLQQLPLELGRRGLEARDRTQQARERGAPV